MKNQKKQATLSVLCLTAAILLAAPAMANLTEEPNSNRVPHCEVAVIEGQAHAERADAGTHEKESEKSQERANWSIGDEFSRPNPPSFMIR